MPSIMQTSKALGMVTMEAAVKELVTRNLVSTEEAAFYLPNPAPAGGR
jgi:Tfp pilus assembly pilus retraction ATPase PilT